MRIELLTTPAEQTDSPRLSPRQGVRRLLALLYRWQARAMQRYRLAATEDRLLDDMGISRRDAIRESEKPFWWV